jgi:hypothetical protein
MPDRTKLEERLQYRRFDLERARSLEASYRREAEKAETDIAEIEKQLSEIVSQITGEV